MIGQAMDVHMLRQYLANGSVREAYVGRQGGSAVHWTLAVRIGGPASRLIPVRSKREPVRTWKSLSSVGKFAEGLGIKALIVEL